MGSRTIEFYDDGRTWRNTVSNDSVIHSTNPDRIVFYSVSPQDSIAYAPSNDKIHYARGQAMGSIQRRSAFKKVFVAPPPPPTDPYFSDVVALLHMDGINGGTSIIDQTGRTWSRSGTGAYLSNEISRFGATSLKNTNYSSDFNTATGILTGTDLFTIEAWFYLLGPAFYGGNYRANSLVTQAPGGPDGGFGLEIDPSGKLRMDFRAGNAGDGGVGGTTVVSYNQWYFFAASWDGTTHRGFLNGNMEYSVAKSFGWKNTGAPFRLGRMVETPSVWERAINGYIDEVRVTKGVARYTANFTPPTEPFLDQ